MAKSTRTRWDIGVDHDNSGEAEGVLRVFWQSWHSRMIRLISRSIPSHHTRLQVIDFLYATSAWTSCSHNRIGCLWKGGITVRSLHIRQPCLKETLYLTTKYGLSIESTYEWTSDPFFESNSACTNTGFLKVSLAMCSRDCVSFYLLRRHMEDSFLNSSIFLELQLGGNLDKESALISANNWN